MPRRDPAEMLDAFEDVLVNLLALCRDLPHEAAELPTDCPGWTVRDQLAHVVGTEQAFAGSPAPPIVLPELGHVRTDFDRSTEPPVEARRLLPLAAITDELAGLLPRRIGQLRALLDDGDPVIVGPFGPRPMSAVLSLRAFDTWIHEQDIRRAVGRPTRIDCRAATISVERAFTAWQHQLPAVEGLDGQLTITVTAPEQCSLTVSLGPGRGPEAEISGDAGAITWVGCGRGTLAAAVDDVRTAGSPEVLAAVAAHLPFTP